MGIYIAKYLTDSLRNIESLLFFSYFHPSQIKYICKYLGEDKVLIYHYSVFLYVICLYQLSIFYFTSWQPMARSGHQKYFWPLFKITNIKTLDIFTKKTPDFQLFLIKTEQNRNLGARAQWLAGLCSWVRHSPWHPAESFGQ